MKAAGKKFLIKNSGMTLIELIVFIVVSGIIISGLVGAFVSITKTGASGTPPENIIKANYLGQQKLEELTKDKFADIAITDTTVSNYAGCTGYTVHYTVKYILATLADSPGGTPTNYKQITVEMTEPGGVQVVYDTMMTKRYNDAPVG